MIGNFLRHEREDPLEKIPCPKCGITVHRANLRGDGCLACHGSRHCPECGYLAPEKYIRESGKCSLCSANAAVAHALEAIENWKPREDDMTRLYKVHAKAEVTWVDSNGKENKHGSVFRGFVATKDFRSIPDVLHRHLQEKNPSETCHHVELLSMERLDEEIVVDEKIAAGA